MTLPRSRAQAHSRAHHRRRAGRARRAACSRSSSPRRGRATAPGTAAARRARRPPARCAASGARVLRAEGARHLRSRPGTRCPTTASAPTPTSSPGASRRWPSSRSAARKEPDRRADHGQRRPAARAAARVHPQRASRPIAPGQRIDMGAADRSGSRLTGYHAQRHRHGARRVRRARRHPRPLSAGPRDARAPRFLRRHAGEHQGLRRRDAAHRPSRCRSSP